MKKVLFLIALALTGIVTYLLNAKKASANTKPVVRRTHHLTNAFSKAKRHAVKT
ncbi:MAG TPA: hypothetical protein VF540_11080 [Segetibacter sp.]